MPPASATSPLPKLPAAKRRRAPSSTVEAPRAPGWWLLLLEGRAPWEYAALLAAWPWLRALPRGDGHPVIVFPGLAAADLTTLPLRRFLAELGYAAYPWQLGMNLGPREGVLENCRALVRSVAERHGSKVSLVGWSLGGVYARELAKDLPDLTRCVVTLGSPFAGHPRSTNAWRLFEWVSGQAADAPEQVERLRRPPPVPTTSIYSRTDGIVAWSCSLNEPGAQAENIEVHSSHVGMGMNPAALYALADRLAQPPQSWQPFALDGARRWFYR